MFVTLLAMGYRTTSIAKSALWHDLPQSRIHVAREQVERISLAIEESYTVSMTRH